jgi:hypothetical protein
MVDGHRRVSEWLSRVCLVVGFSCRRKEFGRNRARVLKAGSICGSRVWFHRISHQNQHRFRVILLWLSIYAPLRTSPALLSMWPCTPKSRRMVWLSKMVSAQQCSTLNFLGLKSPNRESSCCALQLHILSSFFWSTILTEPGSPYTAETNRAVLS